MLEKACAKLPMESGQVLRPEIGLFQSGLRIKGCSKPCSNSRRSDQMITENRQRQGAISIHVISPSCSANLIGKGTVPTTQTAEELQMRSRNVAQQHCKPKKTTRHVVVQSQNCSEASSETCEQIISRFLNNSTTPKIKR